MLVPAGGSGSRFGAAQPKQFLPLAGQPILLHSLRLFERCALVDDVIIAAPAGREDDVRRLIQSAGLGKARRVVTGGSDRQSSVWAALREVEGTHGVVGVHDAARPLLTLEHLTGMLEAAVQYPAQVMAVPVKDTIKIVGEGGIVVQTPDRATLWAAQTPQVFHLDLLRRAHLNAQATGLVGTDESQLVEALGVPVRIYPGSPENFKITTAQDLPLAELILAGRPRYS
jgi:2-C-methyl-D-erythritol 4-phosphate cytidylyltransferase